MNTQNPRTSTEVPSITLPPLIHKTTTSSSASTLTPSSLPRKHKISLSASGFFSRSNSPAPTNIRSRRSTSTSARRSASPDSMLRRDIDSDSDNTTSASIYNHKRASSGSYPRKKGADYRRYSGTVSHCGRHSNDWLFGGFSLRDTVRGGVDRLRQHGGEKS